MQIVSSSISCTSVYLGVFSRCRTARFSPAKRFCGKSSCQLFFSLFCYTVCCTAPLTIKLPTWDSLHALCTFDSSCKMRISSESARICHDCMTHRPPPLIHLLSYFCHRTQNTCILEWSEWNLWKNVGMEEPKVSSYRLTSLIIKPKTLIIVSSPLHLKFAYAAAQKPIHAHAITSVNGSVCGFVFHGGLKTSRSTECGSASVFFDPVNSLLSFWLILHYVSGLHLPSAESLMNP